MSQSFEKEVDNAVYFGLNTLEVSCCNRRALEVACEHMVDEGYQVTKSLKIRLSNEIQSEWSKKVLQAHISNKIH